MNFVALKMLVADRGKYFSIIFAIAFASFLLAQQISIFIGVMTRTASQIRDVVDADIWVMDPQSLYSDEVYALRDYDLYRIRSVPGVEWAVPFYKGTGRAKGPDGFAIGYGSRLRTTRANPGSRAGTTSSMPMLYARSALGTYLVL